MCVSACACVRASEQASKQREQARAEAEPNFLPPNDKLSNLPVSVVDTTVRDLRKII